MVVNLAILVLVTPGWEPRYGRTKSRAGFIYGGGEGGGETSSPLTLNFSPKLFNFTLAQNEKHTHSYAYSLF